MFNLELKIPTYAEWKSQLEKLRKEQPEQAEKYYEIGRASCRERV